MDNVLHLHTYIYITASHTGGGRDFDTAIPLPINVEGELHVSVVVVVRHAEIGQVGRLRANIKLPQLHFRLCGGARQDVSGKGIVGRARVNIKISSSFDNTRLDKKYLHF